MNRDDVQKRLCELTTKVGKEVFGDMKAHDCFCPDADKRLNESMKLEFQFEDDVLRFIETAVSERMAKLARGRLAREND